MLHSILPLNHLQSQTFQNRGGQILQNVISVSEEAVPWNEYLWSSLTCSEVYHPAIKEPCKWKMFELMIWYVIGKKHFYYWQIIHTAMSNNIIFFTSNVVEWIYCGATRGSYCMKNKDYVTSLVYMIGWLIRHCKL